MTEKFFPNFFIQEKKFFQNSTGCHRYGFNGKEKDDETDLQDYGMRIYNAALGRFLSVDPISAKYPELTPYQFASNTPIQAVDLDGLEALVMTLGVRGVLIFGTASTSVSVAFGRRNVMIAATPITGGIGAGLSLGGGVAFSIYPHVGDVTELEQLGFSSGVMFPGAWDVGVNVSPQQGSDGDYNDWRGGITIPAIGTMLKSPIMGNGGQESGLGAYVIDIGYTINLWDGSYPEFHFFIDQKIAEINKKVEEFNQNPSYLSNPMLERQAKDVINRLKDIQGFGDHMYEFFNTYDRLNNKEKIAKSYMLPPVEIIDKSSGDTSNKKVK